MLGAGSAPATSAALLDIMRGHGWSWGATLALSFGQAPRLVHRTPAPQLCPHVTKYVSRPPVLPAPAGLRSGPPQAVGAGRGVGGAWPRDHLSCSSGLS